MLRSNRGFSLIELVVVVIIGTIMTTIVIRGFGNARAGNSVRAAEQNFRGLTMTPRGYADLNQNNFSSLTNITFTQESEVRTVALLPIGQLRNP